MATAATANPKGITGNAQSDSISPADTHSKKGKYEQITCTELLTGGYQTAIHLMKWCFGGFGISVGASIIFANVMLFRIATGKLHVGDWTVACAEAMVHLCLITSGIFTGLCLVFLGFALFMMGVRGNMDVSAQAEKNNFKVTSMAPGTFIIVCGAVLIGLCAIQKCPIERFAIDDSSKPHTGTSQTQK